VAVAVFVIRMPRTPSRRPFESIEDSLIGESTKPHILLRDPGGGSDGGV
jgi:hypothetical protein